MRGISVKTRTEIDLGEAAALFALSVASGTEL
jgi:hypothetical protein